jgi:hypothetical protein
MEYNGVMCLACIDRTIGNAANIPLMQYLGSDKRAVALVRKDGKRLRFV